MLAHGLLRLILASMPKADVLLAQNRAKAQSCLTVTSQHQVQTYPFTLVWSP